jgi:Flp pilus assembly protein TadG
MTRLARYLRTEDAASTAEFAMVLPLLLLFVFGLIQGGMLLFTAGRLHWTVEEAARCASVSLTCRVGGVATGAVNQTTVSAYANTRYGGLAPATFTYSNTGPCSQSATGNSGKVVNGVATFNLNLGVYYRAVPLNATACFP